MNSKYLFSILGVVFLGIAIITMVGVAYPFQASIESSSSDGFNYHGSVCRYVDRWDADTQTYYRESVECNDNVLYNNGSDMIRDILGDGNAGIPLTNISLCNATAGVAGSQGDCATPAAVGTEAYTLYNECGLANTAGTYAENIGIGNWSVFHTFTSTCDDRLTNVTRITNATGHILAGNSFTLVTLQTNDQITVNWTIFVE